MGKATGFLDYERKDNGDIPPAERIKNFNEFHTPLDEAERKKQAARCMDCGVPMCQSAICLKGVVTGWGVTGITSLVGSTAAGALLALLSRLDRKVNTTAAMRMNTMINKTAVNLPFIAGRSFLWNGSIIA